MKKYNLSSKLKVALTAILAIMSLSACSTRNVETTAQVTDEQMFGVYDYILSGEATGFSGSDVSAFNEVRENATFYHVANDESRPAVSVLSLNDTGWIHEDLIGYSSLELGMKYVDVIFTDGHDANGDRRFGLMVLLEGYEGGVVTFSSMSAPGDYQFTDKSFSTTMVGANGEQITLKSRDVSKEYNDELNTSIKLEVWITENGTEYYAGQISAMSSFQ